MIEATCMCLLGKGKECVDKALTAPELEYSIIDECRRCLDQIVHHAQSEQPLFQQMEQAAERAAARLKRSVATHEEEQGKHGTQPAATVPVRGSNVRKRIPV